MARSSMIKYFVEQVRNKAEMTACDAVEECESDNPHEINNAVYDHYWSVASDLGVPYDLREEVVEKAQQ